MEMTVSKNQIKADIGFGTYSAIEMSLTDFKAHLDRLAENIGADAETAQVFIEYEDDQWESGGYIRAYIWRWETDAEEAEREAREMAEELARQQADEAQRQARELATYLALKQKYG